MSAPDLKQRGSARRPAPRSTWAVLVLGGGGLLLLGSCFFAPRSPEPPASGQECQYLPRGEAENILSNIEEALDCKDGGGYDDAISETFTYEPDDQTQSAYPSVDWDGWGQQQEEDFGDWLFQNLNSLVLDLRDSTITVEIPSGTEAEWDVIYFLKVTDDDGETRFRARAELTLRLVGSYWFLDKWVDLNQENDPDTGAELPTMGSLRGAFASK
jgi:hypothetical protein